MLNGAPVSRVVTRPLNRDRVEALAKLILMPVRGHRFTSPAGDTVVGEQLNALALVVAEVIRSGGGDPEPCRAWFDATLSKIIAATRPTENA